MIFPPDFEAWTGVVFTLLRCMQVRMEYEKRTQSVLFLDLLRVGFKQIKAIVLCLTDFTTSAYFLFAHAKASKNIDQEHNNIKYDSKS